jgi:hypothetical protein
VKDYRCCDVASRKRGSETITLPASFARRCRDVGGWMVPAAGLALLPKCPACLAAYIALATGVGISMPTATHIRVLILILCLASLSYLGARRLVRMGARTQLSSRVLRNGYRWLQVHDRPQHPA